MSALLLSLLLFIGTSLATCKYKFIHNASELIEFSNDVSNGTTYEGYTVYLVSDIVFNEELSLQFKQIGYTTDENEYRDFSGTFDGQGYTISNLTVTSSTSMDAGFIGYSLGSTIRNVILDASCSVLNIRNIYSSYRSYTGGILGTCCTVKGSCIIENSVNMASVSFNGSSQYIHHGGIAAAIRNYDTIYEGKIINCVNYGAVVVTGRCAVNLCMGGIIAVVYVRSNVDKVYVYNSANYGMVKNGDLRHITTSEELQELAMALNSITV